MVESREGWRKEGGSKGGTEGGDVRGCKTHSFQENDGFNASLWLSVVPVRQTTLVLVGGKIFALVAMLTGKCKATGKEGTGGPTRAQPLFQTRNGFGSY